MLLSICKYEVSGFIPGLDKSDACCHRLAILCILRNELYSHGNTRRRLVVVVLSVPFRGMEIHGDPTVGPRPSSGPEVKNGKSSAKEERLR